MKKIKLTETELTNIVKRVINEQSTQGMSCSAEILSRGGTLFEMGGNIMMTYKDKGTVNRCIVGPSKGASVRAITK